MDESKALTLPDEAQFRHDIEAINRFQKVVHATMVKDMDYGVIPGTQKPTLLKPGAEKIAKLLGLADQYIILDQQEDWKAGFFRYLIKCQLIHVSNGVVISEGLGECNSLESKYRWRESKRKCPLCEAEAIIKGKEEYGGGWICFKKQGGCGAKFVDGDPEIEEQKIGRMENDDIYSQVNTLLKMAKKRALVDAALSAGRLSDVFTQDIEDLALVEKAEKPTAEPPEQKGHWCSTHNCTFFKKGKMKGYAHKIEGTDEWCNEEERPKTNDSRAIQENLKAIYPPNIRKTSDAWREGEDGQRDAADP